ncbi:MAG: DUF3107 family protein [Acidimicrobiia bacterium]|nr:DUF3107 family protein [Acidimicrobiia bacterium]NNC75096.1 DUF3107 family protein [Acidimicrobiia bacterium]
MAKTRIRIGITSARELEIEIEDAGEFIKSMEAGRTDGSIVWVEDFKGHRHGIVADRVAFIEVQSEDDGSGVGFTAD